MYVKKILATKCVAWRRFFVVGLAWLKVRREALLEVSQIGKICHNRCNIFYTVGDCVMPREGIFAKVLTGGEIKIDDQIEVAD